MNKSNQVEYRNLLISTLQKSQDNYDKAVLTLSGGALGISFAFINNIIGKAYMIYPKLLYISWILWGSSVTFVLVSFYTSILSLNKSIKQVDSDKTYEEKLGGAYTYLTKFLNPLSGLMFLCGLLCFSIFVYLNMRAK